MGRPGISQRPKRQARFRRAVIARSSCQQAFVRFLEFRVVAQIRAQQIVVVSEKSGGLQSLAAHDGVNAAHFVADFPTDFKERGTGHIILHTVLLPAPARLASGVPRQAQAPSGAFQDGAFRSGVKGGRRVKRKPEIGEHIHIIDVGVVRRAVGVEIAVHVAIREPLRGHVVKMVGGLQTPPCAEHAGIARGLDRLLQAIDGFDGVVLHVVAEPCGEIALGVRHDMKCGTSRLATGSNRAAASEGVMNAKPGVRSMTSGKASIKAKIPVDSH